MKKFLTIICCIFMFCTTFALVGCTQEEQPKTYTINFMVEGEVWKTLTSDNLDELGTPTKKYCDFAGWEFDTESVKDHSCDVYARFVLNDRYECVEVLSDSMSPVMWCGDYVIIDTEATEFEVDDIVVYQPSISSLYIVNRIIAVDGDNYAVKGDAVENGMNETITSSQIVGLVCENIGQTLPEDVIG